MSKKEFYIIENYYGCLGSLGKVKKLKERYSNKIKAIKDCNKLKILNTNNRFTYWVDWDWKGEKRILN